jgi:hypothetical protein
VFVVLSRVAFQLWLLCREKKTQEGDWFSCDVQEDYVNRLKDAENWDRERGSCKRLKFENGKEMSVSDDVAALSEEAADWVLLNPGEWANKLIPCVRSSEYPWFNCESDAQFNGFIEVIGQIKPSTFRVENGSSVYHPSRWPVAEDVKGPERVSGDAKTKRGYYCVKAYHDCVREYQGFLMRLQVAVDVEWRDDISDNWKPAFVSKRLRIIDAELWPDDFSVVSSSGSKAYDVAAAGNDRSWWVELSYGGAEWWVCVAGVGFRTELRQGR